MRGVRSFATFGVAALLLVHDALLYWSVIFFSFVLVSLSFLHYKIKLAIFFAIHTVDFFWLTISAKIQKYTDDDTSGCDARGLEECEKNTLLAIFTSYYYAFVLLTFSSMLSIGQTLIYIPFLALILFLTYLNFKNRYDFLTFSDSEHLGFYFDFPQTQFDFSLTTFDIPIFLN